MLVPRGAVFHDVFHEKWRFKPVTNSLIRPCLCPQVRFFMMFFMIKWRFKPVTNSLIRPFVCPEARFFMMFFMKSGGLTRDKQSHPAMLVPRGAVFHDVFHEKWRFKPVTNSLIRPCLCQEARFFMIKWRFEPVTNSLIHPCLCPEARCFMIKWRFKTRDKQSHPAMLVPRGTVFHDKVAV